MLPYRRGTSPLQHYLFDLSFSNLTLLSVLLIFVIRYVSEGCLVDTFGFPFNRLLYLSVKYLSL